LSQLNNNNNNNTSADAFDSVDLSYVPAPLLMPSHRMILVTDLGERIEHSVIEPHKVLHRDPGQLLELHISDDYVRRYKQFRLTFSMFYTKLGVVELVPDSTRRFFFQSSDGVPSNLPLKDFMTKFIVMRLHIF
jgi:hypothetical protein